MCLQNSSSSSCFIAPQVNSNVQEVYIRGTWWRSFFVVLKKKWNDIYFLFQSSTLCVCYWWLDFAREELYRRAHRSTPKERDRLVHPSTLHPFIPFYIIYFFSIFFRQKIIHFLHPFRLHTNVLSLFAHILLWKNARSKYHQVSKVKRTHFSSDWLALKTEISLDKHFLFTNEANKQ